MPDRKRKGILSCCNGSNNVYCQLIQREYFLQKSPRHSYRILGSLITKCEYTFKKVWSETSSQRISCDGSVGFLSSEFTRKIHIKFRKKTLIFFKNYSHCVDSSSFHPYHKFDVQQVSPSKIADALLTEGFPETVDLPYKGYKASMLALTKGNMLLRVDLQNGQLLEQVYVGLPRISFRTIQWNVVGESVALISSLFPSGQRRARQQTEWEKVKELVILSLFPLSFVCKFSVNKQVFGRHATDASVFLNLLTIMYSSGHVRMYSMETILQQYKLHGYQLREPMSDGTFFGVHPSPLTENVEIKELPPCLFEVRCRNRDVMLTLPPCYYIMCPFREENGHCCFSFETHKMVQSGCISKGETSIYEDRIALHADDSGRIVHMTNTQLRLLKLQHDEKRNETELVEDFVITRSIEVQLPSLKVSRSGRILKQRVIPDSVDMFER
ncbi:hypothetical protein RRG08_011297, partial [Elysia crispata]